jgi:putative transposase
MIVGWRVAGHMRTPMVLDAIEMARWNRGLHHPGLRCHSDAGSQFTSIRYGERLAEIGAVPSIGTVGDSYDNALAETVNGYYKAELIRGPARSGPWKTVEQVELATLGWVHWHNTQRLHSYLGDLPPVEFEALHAAREAPDPEMPQKPARTEQRLTHNNINTNNITTRSEEDYATHQADQALA